MIDRNTINHFRILDDDDKIEYLSRLRVEDRVKFAPFLKDQYTVQMEYLKLFKDKKVLIPYFEYFFPGVIGIIIASLDDEDLLLEYAFKYASQLRQSGNSDILRVKIHRDDNLLKVAHSKEFGHLKYQLIARLSKDSLIINEYRKLENDYGRLEVFYELRQLGKVDVIDKLAKLRLFKSKDIESYIESNDERIKERELRGISIDNIKLDIDPKITFGVELEAVNEDDALCENLIRIGSVYGNWMVVADGSVGLKFNSDEVTGIEIVSPVLKYNEDSLKQLKLVTNFMKKLGYQTNDSCGGHIHFGFDYFKTADEFKTFLSIYCAVEDLLYYISNKANSKIRYTDLFAKPACTYIKNLKVNIDKMDSIKDFYVFQQESKYAQERVYGLNLTHLGKKNKNTIEIRIPNGEIDFIELTRNIKLFAKLMELSKRINNSKDRELLSNYQKLIKERNQDKKIELLLDMLFDNNEDKHIYFERYELNSHILKNRNRFTSEHVDFRRR